MVSITAAGTGSGLDIETIIETLTEAERAPTQARIDAREIEVQASISAYGSLKGALEDFRSSFSGLSTLSSLAARSASSSDSEIFTATATNAASIGTTDIEVVQLASNNKLISTANYTGLDDTVGDGTLSISLGTSNFNVVITAGTNDTLAGVRDAINDSASNPGISASILTVSDGMGGTNSKLVLTADDSGADNAITVTATIDSDGDTLDNSGLSAFINANMNETSPAQNAQIILDNDPLLTIESSTNVFTDAIQGVTITALKADPGGSETLNISLDGGTIKSKLAEFVASFNTLSDTLDFLTDYDPEAQEAGLLTGDFTTRTIESQIRRTISNVVEGITGEYSSMASIGITTQRDGTLLLDSSILDEALNSDFDGVSELLAGDDGVISDLDDLLNTFLTTGGTLSTRNQTFLDQLDDIDAQREQLDRRITSFEERIRRQYTSLDILVGQLQNTGNFVTEQLSLIQVGSKKD